MNAIEKETLMGRRVRKPDAELPARKWASKWMIWVQDLMSSFAFYI